MEPKFKVGDIVVVQSGKDIPGYTGGWDSTMENVVGKYAKIKKVNAGLDDTKQTNYDLDFFEKRFTKPYSYLVYDERGLQPYKPVVYYIHQDYENPMVFNGTVYNVHNKGGKNIVLEEVAKCCEYDSFDMNAGLWLAMSRLQEKADKFSKKKPLNTKIVCIESSVEEFEAGKVYKVENGHIFCKGGYYWNESDELVYSLEDINDKQMIGFSGKAFARFIEFNGEDC